MKQLFFFTLLAAALLAACSGGGSGSQPAAVPAAPLPTGAAVATAAPASGTRGTISLLIPASKSSAASARRAQFVSPSSQSAVVAINGGSPASYDVSPVSPNCFAGSGGRTCSLTIGVPAGTTSVSVTLSLYDGATGTGKLLGSGTGSTTIATNATSFTVPLDVSPVVGSVTIALNFALTGLPRISDGIAETGANAGIATLVFMDPDGGVIPSTSTSTFLTPISLSVVDTSGTVSIAPASITNATQTATVSYTGGTTIGSSVTFNAVAGSTPVGTLLSKTSGYQTTYPIGLNTPGNSKEPYGIAVGADGNIWFTEVQNAAIGTINPTTFALTEYAVPNAGSSPMPYAMAPGPSGDPHVWFVEPTNGGANYGYTANVNTTTHVTTAYYTGANASNPMGLLAVGNNMWTTLYGSNQLLVTNATGTPSPSGPATPPPGTDPNGMTVGPDGNVWVAGMGNGTILSYSSTYPYPIVLATSVPAGSMSHPAQLISGPDGAVWFTEQLGNLGRITTAGAVTEIVPPYGQPYAIANGSDGGIWFTSNASPTHIIRIDPTTHAFVTYPLMSQQASWGMVSGPDGNLWATDFLGSKIIRIQP